jgi:hypothetical protein
MVAFGEFGQVAPTADMSGNNGVGDWPHGWLIKDEGLGKHDGPAGKSRLGERAVSASRQHHIQAEPPQSANQAVARPLGAELIEVAAA